MAIYPVIGLAVLTFGLFWLASFFWEKKLTRLAAVCGYPSLLLLVVLAIYTGGYFGWWGLPGWAPFAHGPESKGPVVQNGDGTPRGPQSLKQELEQKVNELQAKNKAMQSVLADLQKEKADITKELNQLVQSKSLAGLRENARAQRRAKRLQEVAGEIAVMEKRAEEYEAALDQGQAVLRRLERHLVLQKAGISESELVEVTTTITLFNERLKGTTSAPASPLELDTVLKKELGWTD
jgi:hypothetical protein